MPPKMYTTEGLQANTFKRGQRVRLVNDLPGVAQGAEGKVAMANGMTWFRYWVRFADGQVVGHIDHTDLVRTRDFERFLVAREREALEAEQAALRGDDQPEAADAGSAGAAAEASGDAVVNGVAIPAYLLQRSADARTRLGA